ncbi:MAG TPA: hypothetical protein VNN13_11340 [Methylomirabilota bacterium]|nr:hypothetical protein [Methylomirabilota bacterium]
MEIGLVHVEQVCFGPQTAIEKNILTINRWELAARLEEEPLFAIQTPELRLCRRT